MEQLSMERETLNTGAHLPEQKEKRKKKFRIPVNAYGVLFILPFFIVYGIFSLFPMFYSVILSLTDYAGYSHRFDFIGFGNFAWLVTQARF